MAIFREIVSSLKFPLLLLSRPKGRSGLKRRERKWKKSKTSGTKIKIRTLSEEQTRPYFVFKSCPKVLARLVKAQSDSNLPGSDLKSGFNPGKSSHEKVLLRVRKEEKTQNNVRKMFSEIGSRPEKVQISTGFR